MSDRIAIIGGGITGLAALHELRVQGHDDVVLLEGSEQCGGKIRTSEFVNQLIDEGPDAFLARVPWALDLVEELGLTDQMISPSTGRAFIWSDGNLHPIPRPNVLGIPLDPEAASGLLSEQAIADLEADMNRAEPDPVRNDDTVGSLVRRRLGDEVFDKLVNPLLGAINAGDLDNLSLQATSPQIASAAASNPSLVHGLLSQRADRDPDAPLFHSFPDGMGRLVNELVARHADFIQTRSSAVDIASKRRNLKVEVSGGDSVSADAVILATPSFVSGPLVGEWAPASSAYAETEYVNVVKVTLSYDKDDVDPDLIRGGSGFLVPRSQSPIITACTWFSSKWSHLDDGEQVILRASLGSAGADAVFNARDADIMGTVKLDLSETMGISAEPRSVRITRWPRAFPQYSPGHMARVETIRNTLHGEKIFPAGAALDGIGVPSCIKSGREAARLALANT